MITIVKDKDKRVVTTQTYENQFKNLGYQILTEIEDVTKATSSVSKNKKEEIKEDNEENIINEKYGLSETAKKNTRTKKTTKK